MSESVRVRPGTRSDAVTIAALATQVFLDTYGTHGIDPSLAREVFHGYSEQAFAARITEAKRKFIVADRGDGTLVGFSEVLCSNLSSPAGSISGAELVRLYVQPRAHGGGIGRLLISEGEQLASAHSLHYLWLTVWEGNASALAFYRRMGYADVGATTYSIESKTYGNRVLAKPL